MIRNLFYNRELPKFNFKKSIGIKMEYYKQLQYVAYNGGRGVDDTTMCMDLVSSILLSAGLEVALLLARNKGILANGYERLVQFFKEEIDNRNHWLKMFGCSRARGVSKLLARSNIQQGGANNYKNGHGCGKQKGKDERLVLNKIVEAREIRSSSYLMDELQKLTKT